MAKKTINLGTGELTGDGESIRSAFDKINDNFDELYAQDGNDVVLSSINASLIPDTDVAYDLGSATKRFRDIYLSGSTIDLGGTTLSVVGGTLQIGGVNINDVVTGAGVDYTNIQNTPNLSQYVKYTDLQDSTITIDVNSTGDLQGNVYGDDSTLLVDGMNSTIPYSVLDGAPTALSDFSNDLDYAGIVGTTIQNNGLPVNTFTTGTLTVNAQLTVEESYSSTPTTKYFEIETGAGNNRLLRTGINMSAFAQEFGPEIDLTSYRSSPANGDAGPGLVLRASTGASVNDVIATIKTEVTDVTNGAVNSKLSFTTKTNGSYATPLTIYGNIEGSNVDMQGADRVWIGNPSGQIKLYGDIEFNNGTTTFVAANSVDFLCDVDLNGEVKFAKTTTTGGASSSVATALDVTKTLQVLNSTDSDDDFWTLADGTEGQIMHFVPGSGTGSNQHYIEIANWRRWDSDTSSWIVEQDLTWTPFRMDFDGTRWTGVATAIFTNGAWQTSNPWVD